MCLYRSITDAVCADSSSFCPILNEDRLLTLLFQPHSLYLIRQRCPARTVDFAFDDTTIICPYVSIKHLVELRDEKCEENCETITCDHERQSRSYEFECEACNQHIEENQLAGKSIDQVRASLQERDLLEASFASCPTNYQPATGETEQRDFLRSAGHKHRSVKAHNPMPAEYPPRSSSPAWRPSPSSSCQPQVVAARKRKRVCHELIVLGPSSDSEARTEFDSDSEKAGTYTRQALKPQSSTDPVIAELQRIASQLEEEMDSDEHQEIRDSVLNGTFVDALQHFATNPSSVDRMPASTTTHLQQSGHVTVVDNMSNALQAGRSTEDGAVAADAAVAAVASPISAASASLVDGYAGTPATSTTTATPNVNRSPTLERTASAAFVGSTNGVRLSSATPTGPVNTNTRHNYYRRSLVANGNLAASTNPFPPNFDINAYGRDWCHRFYQRLIAHNNRLRDRVGTLQARLCTAEQDIVTIHEQYDTLVQEQLANNTVVLSNMLDAHQQQQLHYQTEIESNASYARASHQVQEEGLSQTSNQTVSTTDSGSPVGVVEAGGVHAGDASNNNAASSSQVTSAGAVDVDMTGGGETAGQLADQSQGMNQESSLTENMVKEEKD